MMASVREEEQEKTYNWEGDYEKTWEAIKEDESGSLQTLIDDIVQRAKRRRLVDRPTNVRLGMMRHLFIVLDMSRAMEDQDLKPNRLAATVQLLEHFVEEYFDQNPISQLGIITTFNKRAEKLSELGGNPKRHITALQSCKDKPCSREPSLQNSLELAASTLKHMPNHTSREILVVMGSLTTCDPGDIEETIKNMKELNIRCSHISLAAEVRIFRKLCKDTQGSFGVILDEHHFKELLKEHVSPPPATVDTEPSLMRMGFPQHQIFSEDTDSPSMCICHLDSKISSGFSTSGYFCPQCRSKYCELPVECKACGLTLVSAPHLARSFHHLFPLDRFQEVPPEANGIQNHLQGASCFACQANFKGQPVSQCPNCQKNFCLDCEVFIHESLHSCPGCSSTWPSNAGENTS